MKAMDFTITDKLIDIALIEDLGPGDITSEGIFDAGSNGRAVIKAKEDLVLCGIDVAKRVFLKIDPALVVVKSFADGDFVKKGDVLLKIEGSILSLLKAERTALNFMQRLSGIATNTAKYVNKLKPYPDVVVTDTRKTTPGLRVLEKYGVKCGGAANHRTGLYDGVLIKDNHIEGAGGIKNAVLSVRKNISHLVKIEVEVKDLEETAQALEVKADVIMLDNMDIETIKKAVALIDKKAVVEVSGGVNFDTIEDLAKTGVDVISCGALIHHAVSSDISMYIENC